MRIMVVLVRAQRQRGLPLLEEATYLDGSQRLFWGLPHPRCGLVNLSVVVANQRVFVVLTRSVSHVRVIA